MGAAKGSTGLSGQSEGEGATPAPPEAAPPSLRPRFKDACCALGLAHLEHSAWENYKRIKNVFTLAGDPIHWAGLSLYIEAKTSVLPKEREVIWSIEGNPASLTKLSRLFNISLLDFFNKIKNLMDMVSTSDTLKRRIDKLERSFAVTAVLFKKLQKIFYNIFFPTDHVKPQKRKSNQCTSDSLFEFTWCLFICVKGEFPTLSDDLVNMYHLLLGCIDFVFSNAFLGLRKDIINPAFEGLPSNWLSPKFKTSEAPCILPHLCHKYQVSEVEAKTMKQYKLKGILENFFDKQFLKGNNTFTGVIDPANFEFNLQSLHKIYGTYMLKVGDFDERVVLGLNSGTKEFEEDILKAIRSYETNTVIPSTPLTGRQHLNNRNDVLTPVSMVIHQINKLYAYLHQLSNSPSPTLNALFEECQRNPIDAIKMRQRALGVQFLTGYAPISSEDVAIERLHLIEVFYYRLLEDIIKEERRKKPSINLQNMFDYEIFHKALFACCTEIIIHAFNSNIARFPWVLDCYKLEAFNFYKIIEVVVLTVRERLSRDTIKHLNFIEEHILETLAWKSNSPLWNKIEQSTESLPSYADVCIPESSSVNHPNGLIEKKQNDDTIKPGQSLLNNSPGNVGECSTGNNNDSLFPRRRTTKISPLDLFFRKFYSLAYIRLRNLCTNLGIRDEPLITKIWTCLERGIIQHTCLMKDRHFDQILMCTVYAMCRISHSDTNQVLKKFQEIMRCYRLQPQAKKEVYRDVLIFPHEGGDENVSPSSQNQKTEPQRGDLIGFYNNIFVKLMTELVFVLAGKKDGEVPILSPLPEIFRNGSNRIANSGAHRVSDNHNLYVYSLTTPSSEPTPSYRFSRNSVKDLRYINNIVGQEMKSIKRPFTLDDNVPNTSSEIRFTTVPIKRKCEDLHKEIFSIKKKSSSNDNDMQNGQ